MNISIDIKLNEELFINKIEKMDNMEKHEYFMMYLKLEMSKGLNEFEGTVKFLMDENVPQKYKELYRKKQHQVIEAMDLDEYPERPKLKY